MKKFSNRFIKLDTIIIAYIVFFLGFNVSSMVKEQKKRKQNKNEVKKCTQHYHDFLIKISKYNNLNSKTLSKKIK